MTDKVTALEKAPFRITPLKDKKDQPFLKVETGKIICDLANLITPKAYKEGSIPTYAVRGLFSPKSQLGKVFYDTLINHEKQLFKTSTIIHAKAATAKTDKRTVLVPSVCRLGSELLVEKKEHDLFYADAIKAKTEKRQYYENMNYLENYCQIIARTSEAIPPIIKDKNGIIIPKENLSDEMFSPSFYGRLMLSIKLLKVATGHMLKAYLSSVIYLGIADEKYHFVKPYVYGFESETVDQNDMFDDPVEHDDINAYLESM
jgi:hypothetical protein